MMIRILREQAEFLQRNEEVGGTQVAVVFRDLVLKNQVVSERVPRQVRDQTVVLMPIIPVVGENQVGTALSFHRLEIVLDLGAEEREESITVLLNLDLLSSSTRERLGALPGLASPFFIRAEDDPVDDHVFEPLKEGQDRAAAADLDVVAVCSKAEHPEHCVGRFA